MEKAKEEMRTTLGEMWGVRVAKQGHLQQGVRDYQQAMGRGHRQGDAPWLWKMVIGDGGG